MRYIRIFIALLLIARCDVVAAQGKNDRPGDGVKSETNTGVHTIPGAISRTIKQDRNGNIWIAAFDGVFRYDGKSFINITGPVSAARFFAVLEDSNGNFWFTSVGEGVYYYDGDSFRQFTTAHGLANNRVIDVHEDRAGNIWFATDEGASRYDGKSFQTYRMKWDLPILNDSSVSTSQRWKVSSSFPNSSNRDSDDNQVNSIIEDKRGNILFGTRGNAYLYDGKAMTSFVYGSTFRNVRSMIEDRKGNLWLGGNDGLWRYDGNAWTQFGTNFVGYVYEDSKGSIWASTYKDGDWVLTRYEASSLNSKSPTATGIKSQYEGNRGMIFGILEASDGSIWFGALDGVHRYDGKTISDFTARDGQ